MKIYAMTATFGKLNRETLTLRPGMNVIQAPNEWGKSTWCAFIAAMLYGLDTRAKSTKTTLADKDRFAPWSGTPMEGRMDIRWKDRDITIQRRTKGRIPLGDFRAYETKTGVEVPELAARNCGELLLGVERSVFLRSCFVRLSDMPVTDDEALRRRLHALVTTGDESGSGERLAKSLKELKNRCRYNRTGLLPQAEAERAALESGIAELEDLEGKCNRLQIRLQENGDWIEKLENHQTALRYREAQADAQRVALARSQWEDASARLAEMEAQSENLPSRDQVDQMLEAIRQLEMEAEALQAQAQMLRTEAALATLPAFARGLDPEALLQQTRADGEIHKSLSKKYTMWFLLGLIILLAGGAAAYWYWLPGLAAAGCGLLILLVTAILSAMRKEKRRKLEAKYGSSDPNGWVREALQYLDDTRHFDEMTRQQAQLQAAFRERAEAQAEKTRQVTCGKGLARIRAEWETAREQWNALAEAERECGNAESHWQTLLAMAKPMPPEPKPDGLDLDAGQTLRQLQTAAQEQLRLQKLLSQYTGRMEALGDREQKRKELSRLNERIRKLEKTYEALTLAQETLAQANTELQRRFAPRIASGARTRMGMLTGGRYDKLQLGSDLHLLAGTEGEGTLREALWRSDGTVDQLYLALRLSVAEALTPDAPLILDDALVRFDDTRLKAAMALLSREAEHRQVILFSCQERETALIKKDALS